MFGRIIGLQKKLTIDNLRLQKMLIVNVCPLYLSDAESVNHLLLHCRFSHQMWVHFFQLMGTALCLPQAWCKLFNLKGGVR